MAAYAALVSLSKVIDLILPHNKAHVTLCSKKQMRSLHQKVALLQGVLEDLSPRSESSIDVLESRIRDVAYRLEDIIETNNISSHKGKIKSYAFGWYAFGSCAKEVGILLDEAIEMKKNLQSHPAKSPESDIWGQEVHDLATTSSSSEAPPTANVDLIDYPIKIMDRIIRRGSKLEIVPITGMGGIGKTTIARAVYQHPKTQRHFDICSWATFSQEYNIKKILRGLLQSDQQDVPDEQLVECVHKRLIGRRYLIVLDDVWDENAWDRVRNALPDDNKGSRIILTTRLLDVAAYVVSLDLVIQMPFLTKEQSWSLLQEKVIGKNMHLPQKFEDLGRKISRNCRGLPLAIVAIAGVLKFNMAEEYWEQVAEKTNSDAATNYDDHLFSILALSYTSLPLYLRACFLYFGLFKEDYEISTEELQRLWTAEGFLKAIGSKETEDVAEEYLEELVARSLVLVEHKGHDGRIKTCSIHDVLRELSLRKAHEENFCHHISARSSSWLDRYSTNDLRRASIDPFCFPERLVYHTHVRSLQHDESKEDPSVILHFKLLRLLGRVLISKNSQLRILYELNNLRYIHIYLCSFYDDRPPLIVGESISRLQNLETLIFSGTWRTRIGAYKLLLPSVIWEMPRLRHLSFVEGSKFLCPSLSEIFCSCLRTITGVTNFDLTRSMTSRLPNLKKLKLSYSRITGDKSHEFCLDNLVHLHQLEELAIKCECGARVTDLSFPIKLKKLSMRYTEMPVEKMSLIGSLPNLEVLKLKMRAVYGEEWEPIEGEFAQLKYLQLDNLWLEEWRAESEHFPQLVTLIIKECSYLKEVPAGIGEIDTLQKLVLEDCNKAAEESVEDIQVEQENQCNDSLQIIIIRRETC